MEPLKRIVAVHDLSGVGKCSLTVALPIISAGGVECSCLPTAVLSTHTGEFTGYVVHDLSDMMEPMAQHWQRENLRVDGIYSGYLTGPAQVESLMRVQRLLGGEETKIIVDPVMADNGKYYAGFGGEMCAAFRRLIAHADIITPNVTEAALLAEVSLPKDGVHSPDFVSELTEKLCELCTGVVAITGIHPSEGGKLGTVARDSRSGKTYSVFQTEREGVFYGTGDIFASSIAALLVRGASLEKALELSAELVERSIDLSLDLTAPRRYGVAFERALPEYIRRVAELF
jgi:pyridoxine kinase